MRRRAGAGDWQLALRMVFVSLVLVGLVVALFAGVIALLLADVGWAPYVALLVVAVAVPFAYRYRSPPSALLRSAGASFDESELASRIDTAVRRLAVLADVAPPRVAVVETPAANAFSVGLRQEASVIAVTSGICELLEPAELDAVLAHELSHIANRDTAVMTIASVPRGIGSALDATPVWPVGIVLTGLGSLLTLAISRYREYAADRGSALVTGRPATLMSALTKLEAGAEIPTGDLRAVGALCIVSPGLARRELLMDHPPLAKRLAHLAELDRTMGLAEPG